MFLAQMEPFTPDAPARLVAMYYPTDFAGFRLGTLWFGARVGQRN